MSKRFRNRHFLWWDLLRAALTFAVVFAIARLTSSDDDVVALLRMNRAPLYGGIAQVAGSLLGFIITAISIVYVLVDTPVFTRMREQGQLGSLLPAYFHAILALAALTVWGLVALLIDSDAQPRVAVSWVTLLLVLVVVARVWRCIHILGLMAAVVGSNGSPAS
jgi:hypothetical protein